MATMTHSLAMTQSELEREGDQDRLRRGSADRLAEWRRVTHFSQARVVGLASW